MEEITDETALERGRRDYRRQAWSSACAALTAADQRSPIAIDDLELLATAGYLAGEDVASDALWTRAFQQRQRDGDAGRAARCAFWIAFRLLNVGDVARGGGWAARARRALAEGGEPDCVEQGYVRYLGALQAIFGSDPIAAAAGFAAAAAVGVRFGDADLVTLSHTGEGRARIYLGDTADGVALLDEAMVAITAGEVSPVIVGDSYCSVIEACSELFDVGRVHAWTSALGAWCDAQPELLPFRGQCLVHRSEMLQLRGQWSDALEQAREACLRLSRPVERPAVGAAHYQQAELHRLRGDFGSAEAAYKRASAAGRDPQPGLALLRLAQGREEGARAVIRRALDEAAEPIARARLLPAAVQLSLAAADRDAARQAAGELRQTAAMLRAPMLRALAATATGLTLRADGDPHAALQSLRQAASLWTELRAPYELARVRVEIAEACRELGDAESAALEIDAALATFESLGAVPDAARLGRVAGAGELTSREVEVLRDVAAGKSNREIAAALVISERTVERHVSNIFAKLAITSRAAATAYAYEHQLL